MKKVTDLVIVGVGGHGRELLDVVEAVNSVTPTWNFIGFLDDNADHPTLAQARGARILGPVSELKALKCSYALGIGNPSTRLKLDQMAEDCGAQPADLRHPTAVVGGGATIGKGCVLAANVVVTTNVVLGRSVHINVASSVSHDCVLGDYTILAPGVRLAGGVRTGVGVDIGVGAVVRPQVNIGDGAIVGAGAAVIGDVEAGSVVAGVPARRIR